MAGAGLDPDQHRGIACLRVLECRDVLEAVARHDTIVRVRRGHQGGRIDRALADVVIGRVAVQGLELLGVVCRAVVVDPEAPGSELVEAQHIHHAHGRQRSSE